MQTGRAHDLRGLTYSANGKIYASGHAGTEDASRRTVVARFNADGSPDTAFGDGGFVDIDVAAGREDLSFAVAELADGDALVTVNAIDDDGGQSVYLLRMDESGTRLTAPAWGDADGLVEVVFGWPNADNAMYRGETPPRDAAWDMQLDTGAGERVVIFGEGSAPQDSGRTDRDRYVVRLNAADGSPDPAVNGGAPYAYHSVAEFADTQRRGMVESDGAIVAAGYTDFGEGLRHHVVLIRLTPGGEPDPTFGNFIEPAGAATQAGLVAQAGVAVFNPFKVDGGYAEGYGVVRQSDGSYVATGYGEVTADGVASTLGFETTLAQDLVAFRLPAGGTSIDSTWGRHGTQAVQSEGNARLPTGEDRGRNVVVLPDDRTAHVGRYGGIPAVVVLTADGQLDTAEGNDGIFELPHPDIDSQFFNVALSSDSTRIAATTSTNDNGARLVVLEIQY